MIELNGWVTGIVLLLALVGAYVVVKRVYREILSFINNLQRSRNIDRMIASLDEEYKIKYTHSEDEHGNISR